MIFPEPYSASDEFELRLRTPWSLLDLHRRNSENREHVSHYTNDYIHHFRAQCPFEVGLEASGEKINALKKIDQTI